ncbi:hypothetical protein ANCDUO_27058, partial [Ancylostoma duodenale]
MPRAQSDVLQGHHRRLKLVWEFIKALHSPPPVHPLHGHDIVRSPVISTMNTPLCRRCDGCCEYPGGTPAKVQAWKDRLEQYGMRLNTKKTEYVECGEQTPCTILVDDSEPPKVSTFKYLGSRITAD